MYKLKLLNLYNRLYSTFHISLLEEYMVKEGQGPNLYPAGEFPELADNNEEQEWEVEAIVDHKQDGRYKERQYLVKWRSWPDDHNTWLPAFPNLENAKDLLKSYNKNQGLEPIRTS